MTARNASCGWPPRRGCGGPGRWPTTPAGPGRPALFTDCTLRLSGVAAALTAVGALEAERADDILSQFQAALAVRRRLQPQHAGPVLRRGTRGLFPAGSAPPPQPAKPEVPPPAPWRLWPVGRMLPFRDEFAAGELYVLSLLVTAERARGAGHRLDPPG